MLWLLNSLCCTQLTGGLTESRSLSCLSFSSCLSWPPAQPTTSRSRTTRATTSGRASLSSWSVACPASPGSGGRWRLEGLSQHPFSQEGGTAVWSRLYHQDGQELAEIIAHDDIKIIQDDRVTFEKRVFQDLAIFKLQVTEPFLT